MNTEVNCKILFVIMKKLSLSSIGMKIESYNYNLLYGLKRKTFKIYTLKQIALAYQYNK